jgi:hypothetical protein
MTHFPVARIFSWRADAFSIEQEFPRTADSLFAQVDRNIAMRTTLERPPAIREAFMNKESSSPQIHPNASRASNALVAFFADALSIGIGAGALGRAVAGIVVLLLDGSSAVRERVSNAPMTHPASRVSDDLARLFERKVRESEAKLRNPGSLA